jgi:hypothetical protein
MNINIADINKSNPCITRAWRQVLYESCVICLYRKGHNCNGTNFDISGDQAILAKLKWKDIYNDQLNRTYSEQNKATELGAECLAMLIVQKLTPLAVVKRTQGKNGFDYFLGKKDDTLFQDSARFEISGIFEGTDAMIDYRFSKKIDQTKLSEKSGLPGYAVVIEFNNPKAKFGKV